MNTLAKQFRKKRMCDGALELASLQMNLKYYTEINNPNLKRNNLSIDTDHPSDVGTYTYKDSNKLVEEFMLLANTTVAKVCLSHFPSFTLLRYHPPPNESKLNLLGLLIKSSGFDDFKYANSKELSHSLSTINRCDSTFNLVIRILVTRCMNQAYYICSGSQLNMENTYDTDLQHIFRHYGLATDMYTHFTSPIRRYADIIVHRLLAAAIGLIELPPNLTDTLKIAAICEKINIRQVNSRWASRCSVDYYAYQYFKTHPISEVKAIILNIKKKGIQIQIPKYGIENVVPIDNIQIKWNEETKDAVIVYPDTGHEETLKIFDYVYVQIYSDCSDLRPKVVAKILRKTEVPTELDINS